MEYICWLLVYYYARDHAQTPVCYSISFSQYFVYYFFFCLLFYFFFIFILFRCDAIDQCTLPIHKQQFNMRVSANINQYHWIWLEWVETPLLNRTNNIIQQQIYTPFHEKKKKIVVKSKQQSTLLTTTSILYLLHIYIYMLDSNTNIITKKFVSS